MEPRILPMVPVLKDYLWGGTKLPREYHKKSTLEKVAESWEVSCHKDGLSRIAKGPDQGKTLQEYCEEHGMDQVVGTKGKGCKEFPLLIKLIDAKDNLSLQVHPDDEYARKVEGEPGKTEMWYVIDHEPGAKLIYGFRQEITPEEMKRAIEDNTILSLVNQVPVKQGDIFFVEAGMIHGIGAGITVAEIQQNSNTTYRIYDYGRKGTDGLPRPLHIAKALEVTNCHKTIPDTAPRGPEKSLPGRKERLLLSCDKFSVWEEKIQGESAWEIGKDSFRTFTVIRGEVSLGSSEKEMLHLDQGESVFLPAGCGKVLLKGQGVALVSEL